MKQVLIGLFILFIAMGQPQAQPDHRNAVAEAVAGIVSKGTDRLFLETLWIAWVGGTLAHQGVQQVRKHPYAALFSVLILAGITQRARLAKLTQPRRLKGFLTKCVSLVGQAASDLWGDDDNLLRAATGHSSTQQLQRRPANDDDEREA